MIDEMIDEIKEMDSLNIENFQHIVRSEHLDAVLFGIDWVYENILNYIFSTVDYEFIYRIINLITSLRELIRPLPMIAILFVFVLVTYLFYTYPYRLLYEEINMRSPQYAYFPMLDVVQLLNAGNLSGFFLWLGFIPLVGPLILRVLMLVAELRMYKDFGMKRNGLIFSALLSFIPLPIVPWYMVARMHRYEYKGNLHRKYIYQTTESGML